MTADTTAAPPPPLEATSSSSSDAAISLSHEGPTMSYHQPAATTAADAAGSAADGFDVEKVAAAAGASKEDSSGASVHSSPLYLDSNGDLVTVNEHRDLKRGLGQRHLSMIALAGAIGTGLFLGLGGSIQSGGPLGALLGYATVGLIVCAVQYALGETSALLPVTGSLVRHAEFLFDPALGFAAGWNLVYGNLLSIPSEITAICVLIDFWAEGSINKTAFILPFIAVTFLVGICFVRVFGEVEFGMAMLKIALVIFLVVFGLVVNLGGVPGIERVGFRYWRDPGPFVGDTSWARFLGYWSVMTSAVFSFAGVESLAMAAAETRNPRRAIPRACKRIFIRVTVFYLLSIFVVGMLVASNDGRLDGYGETAAQSPFVIAASAAGYPAVASVVNAIVITSAWSSSNQALLSGTRVLYGLALKKQAPALFLKTTSWGTPYNCVLLYTLFMFLSFMSLSNDALTVFYWFVDLTAAGVLVSWSVILFNHIRLKRAMKVQGIPFSCLPWNAGWTYHSSHVALGFCILILLTNGYSVFTTGGWDAATFVSAYLDIPLVLAAYLVWKLFKKTKITSLPDIPLHAAFRQAEEFPDEPEPRTKGWIRCISWIWD
ncbi:uncharacterized protein PFL1_06399 [Pseudozyma flocculosa PF-1]|uniref:Related to general amino acid permease n=2 Tax=Pseudozyma flocculosa TaxID=84751 RepID=A0A5C3EX58_9BASI|nr:uncharacterized protein PFL1_06399 [Pseudozyma flocculosa PF-1]EPQ25944.1 hypothetical protein PFL1_06399 [Pseudozyma flocculosa PF-1]SPO35759.1 related to general amino acid permease [Pseudozyma flocculosa]